MLTVFVNAICTAINYYNVFGMLRQVLIMSIKATLEFKDILRNIALAKVLVVV